VLADVIAGFHAAFIVFLIGGGIATVRWPVLLRFHVVAVIAMATVNLLGMDCPLTVWQKHFMSHPYRDGFVDHYLVKPLHPAGTTAPVRLLIIACWVVPTAAAYATLASRRFGRGATVRA